MPAASGDFAEICRRLGIGLVIIAPHEAPVVVHHPVPTFGELWPPQQPQFWTTMHRMAMENNPRLPKVPDGTV
ncbi:MAG: hypothetical protein ACYCOU_24360 [Sulfobacillus sp.]